MTSYLATIASRDLKSSDRDSRSNRESSSSRLVDLSGAIMPRLPSAYESWRSGVAGEPTVREQAWSGDEDRDAEPSIEHSPIRVKGDMSAELHLPAKNRAANENDPSPSARKRRAGAKSIVQSESTSDRPGESRMNKPREVSTVRAVPTQQRENVVVRAVLRNDARIAASEDPKQVAFESRGDKGNRPVEPARSNQIIVSPNRENSPLSHRGGLSNRGEQQQIEVASREAYEPAVIVTIGRIEVKAVTPAPIARSSPERRPLMSLDDYLQQRVRGAR